MGLVICPECGSSVSDEEEECFCCGALLNVTKKASEGQIVEEEEPAEIEIPRAVEQPNIQASLPVRESVPGYNRMPMAASEAFSADKQNSKTMSTERLSKGYYILWLSLAAYILSIFVFPLCIVLFPVPFFLFSFMYFRSPSFLSIKESISSYIEDCNGLNNHIMELRTTYASIQKTDYGEAAFSNISAYNYKKHSLSKANYTPNIYDCSRQVCDGARKQPFKYLCKYFNIKANEETLAQFERVLNNFLAAEDGKILASNKRSEILKRISKDIPFIIRKLFPSKLNRELGFQEYRFNSVYYPTYSFRYISSGGKSGTQFDITMDIQMLERFINYLGEVVKFKKSVAGQRRLMTPKLRASIIERDNKTCQMCGNSTNIEPNLLLEVDHIIPLSKGGITSVENLQCLCWKCNRSKGAKI